MHLNNRDEPIQLCSAAQSSYVRLSVRVCLWETKTHLGNSVSTLWPGHAVQSGAAARDYSMQCDRPSHLLRVMKSSRLPRYTDPVTHGPVHLLNLLVDPNGHMMHNVWLFHKSNSLSGQTKWQTGLLSWLTNRAFSFTRGPPQRSTTLVQRKNWGGKIPWIQSWAAPPSQANVWET